MTAEQRIQELIDPVDHRCNRALTAALRTQNLDALESCLTVVGVDKALSQPMYRTALFAGRTRGTFHAVALTVFFRRTQALGADFDSVAMERTLAFCSRLIRANAPVFLACPDQAVADDTKHVANRFVRFVWKPTTAASMASLFGQYIDAGVVDPSKPCGEGLKEPLVRMTPIEAAIKLGNLDACRFLLSRPGGLDFVADPHHVVRAYAPAALRVELEALVTEALMLRSMQGLKPRPRAASSARSARVV